MSYSAEFAGTYIVNRWIIYSNTLFLVTEKIEYNKVYL